MNIRATVIEYSVHAIKSTEQEIIMTRTIWGREPAVFWSLVATLVQALLLLVPWSDEVHGALNALTLAVAGLLTAAWVSVDAALPMLTGVVKAVLAVVLAFGLHLSDNTQVAILAVVGAVVALLVRQQVTAQVPARAVPSAFRTAA